jgi:hypothetical protein
VTSPVDICQEALNEIGSRSTLTALNDPTPQAQACQRAYDPMRKALLRAAPWGFSRKQLFLTQLKNAASDASMPFPWMYEYGYPSDCLKMRYTLQVPNGYPFPTTVAPATGDSLLFPVYPTSRRAKFLLSTDLDAYGKNQKVILSNLTQAIGVYSYDVQDPDLFDSMFWEALVALIAEKLIMPLTGNVGLKGQYLQIAKERVMEARAADGNEGLPTTDHTPDWIQVRGFMADWYYSGFPAFGGGLSGMYGEGWDNLGWGE